MRRILGGVVVVLMLMVRAAVAQQPEASSQIVVTAAELKWGEPPPAFEKGASFTVVSGDPSKAGIFVVRLKMPAGYKVAAHWHPTDEHVTVISGTFAVGHGETFNKATMKELPAGGYVFFPAEMRHFVVAPTAATVQIEGPGPFALTYVNPADDPRQRSSRK
jgi:quercetin dioxygenase-like cupin family protein